MSRPYPLAADAVDPDLVPKRPLASGAAIPVVGLGTFGSDSVTGEAVAEAVVEAAHVGYRHFDCASVYGNEHLIGPSLREILRSGVRREDLWVTSKLWNDKHGERDVVPSCEKSLRDLQLDHLDLYLVHWPFPNFHPPGCDVTSRSTDARPYVHESYMKTWRQMEALVHRGLVRHIGTSNMTIPKLELLLRDAEVPPAANEMELHPHFQQPELLRYVVDHGIVPVGYSPIGSPGRPERDRTPEDTVDVEDPVIVSIARASRRAPGGGLPEVGPAARARRHPLLREAGELPREPAGRRRGAAHGRGHEGDRGDRQELPAHQGPGVPVAGRTELGGPVGHRRPDRPVNGRSRGGRIAWAAALAVATLAARPAVPEDRQDAKAQAILKSVDAGVAAGPFEAAWPSLERYEVPDWYRDGKFGIFIHWGLYSVPAFGNEWYPRNMYKQGTPEFAHHVATFGPQSRFGYKDFIPRFKAERFSAGEWARLFKEAGARFVVPVAEHHDGFPMYDCSLTEWSAAKMGPKRDLVGELARAVPAEGLVFGLSSHRAEHWWFLDGGMEFDSDVKDPRYAAFYGPARPQKKAEDQSEPPTKEYLDDWLARTAELVDKYHPQLVWFDWWIEQPAFAPYLQRFAAFYYNRGAQWQKGVAINYKNASFPAKAAVFDVERGQLPGIRTEFWQTDTSISKNSWGYVAKQDYKTAGAIVDDLVDIVSKNGALLLNIGPRPDGTIPEPEQEILREIGRWLKVNGEAIYGTRPWAVVRRGADRGRGRELQRHEAAGVHGTGPPLHDEGAAALRDRARPAGKEPHREVARHHGAPSRRDE